MATEVLTVRLPQSRPRETSAGGSGGRQRMLAAGAEEMERSLLWVQLIGSDCWLLLRAVLGDPRVPRSSMRTAGGQRVHGDQQGCTSHEQSRQLGTKSGPERAAIKLQPRAQKVEPRGLSHPTYWIKFFYPDR